MEVGTEVDVDMKVGTELDMEEVDEEYTEIDVQSSETKPTYSNTGK